jgi:hypothetical protein
MKDNLDYLESRILNQINEIKLKRARAKMLVGRVLSGVSFVALFPIFINIFSQLQTSGFWNYLSLVFTDTSTVAVYWKEFSLSLVDALPIVSVGLVFALLLVLLTSLRFSIQDYKLIKSYEF